MMQVTSFIRKYHICMASFLLFCASILIAATCSCPPIVSNRFSRQRVTGGNVQGTLSSASTNLISIGMAGLFLPFILLHTPRGISSMD